MRTWKKDKKYVKKYEILERSSILYSINEVDLYMSNKLINIKQHGKYNKLGNNYPAEETH